MGLKSFTFSYVRARFMALLFCLPSKIYRFLLPPEKTVWISLAHGAGPFRRNSASS